MSAVNVKKGTVAPKSTSATFHWEIKNFCMSCKDVGNCIESPEFSTVFSDVTRWQLLIYPKGYTNENKNFVSLFIKNLSSKIVAANVTLSLLNKTDSKVVSYKIAENSFKAGSGWGLPTYATKQFVMDHKNGLLLDDTLKVQCDISCSDPEYTANLQFFASLKDDNENELPLNFRLQEFDDYEKLLETGRFSDVTIAVGKTTFQAHKAIITNRSTVFEAMFNNDMKEKIENTIEITDIKSEVMKEVLRFMYAGKVNNIENLANDLLIAAEKYSIVGLKKLCVKTMHKTLKIKNALEFLKLADLCNAADLKSLVIKFIVSNQKDIAEKPEFGLFTDLHSGVQLELVRAIIAKNSIE